MVYYDCIIDVGLVVHRQQIFGRMGAAISGIQESVDGSRLGCHWRRRSTREDMEDM